MSARLGLALGLVIGSLALSPASGEAATVQCGHGFIGGVPFAHVTLTISSSSMAGIYRPAAFRSRAKSDCELASMVAEGGAQPHQNNARFVLAGAHFYVGLYRCAFGQTAQELPFGPSPLAEWGRCTHTGRDPNTVRFLVLEVGTRAKLVEESEE